MQDAHVNLRLSEIPVCDRKQEPVSSGIPWPKGKLHVGDNLVVHDKSGRRLHMQARALAFWPDGSVKWTLITARIDARRKQQLDLRLSQSNSSGSPVLSPNSRNPTSSSLKVKKEMSRIGIDTGCMRLSVDATGGGLIRNLQVRDSNGRWRQMLKPEGLGIYVNRCDPDGTARTAFTNVTDNDPDRRSRPLPPKGFDTDAEDPPYNVSIIEQGPERVGLRIAGTHVNGKGKRFCPYVIHLYTYANSTRIDLQHTLIYTGLPEKDLISGFGLTIPLRLGKSGIAGHFAGDDGEAVRTEVQATPAHPKWTNARLTQMLAEGYLLEKWTGSDCGKIKILEGRRNPGWTQFGDDNTSCIACVRDFWQQYPKAFSTDAVNGNMKIELWPDSVAPWDLRRYSHEFYPDLYEYTRPDLWSKFPEETHGARGIAKTHDLSFVFHADAPDTTEIEKTGQTLSEPLFLVAAPEWYCKSGALGTLTCADPEHFPKLEKTFAGYTDFMISEKERCRWYGMVDYGDFQMTYAREDYNSPRKTSPATAKRRWLSDVGGHAWVNTEARPDQWLWFAFFLTGRSDFLSAAAAMSRHNRDIDSYHWGNFKGSGSRHNVNHWGCADKEWRISMPISLRVHYYLTGDAWTRETINDAIANYQRYRSLETSLAPSGTAAMSGLLVKSELTGLAEDNATLRRMADIYAGSLRPNNTFASKIKIDLLTGKGEVAGDGDMEDRIFFLLGFGGIQTLIEVAELVEHRPLLETLVKFAGSRMNRKYDWAAAFPGGQAVSDIFHLHLYSLAWRQTGERRFLRRIQKRLQGMKPALSFENTSVAGVPTGKSIVPCEGRKQTCYFGDVCMQIAFGMTALKQE